MRRTRTNGKRVSSFALLLLSLSHGSRQSVEQLYEMLVALTTLYLIAEFVQNGHLKLANKSRVCATSKNRFLPAVSWKAVTPTDLSWVSLVPQNELPE